MQRKLNLIIAIVLIAVLTTSLAGCSGSSSNKFADQDFLKDFTAQVEASHDPEKGSMMVEDDDIRNDALKSELGKLEKYVDLNFEDSSLQEKALTYIQELSKFAYGDNNEVAMIIARNEIIDEYGVEFNSEIQGYIDDTRKAIEGALNSPDTSTDYSGAVENDSDSNSEMEYELGYQVGYSKGRAGGTNPYGYGSGKSESYKNGFYDGHTKGTSEYLVDSATTQNGDYDDPADPYD
jgi:hypothetical protein